MRAVSLCRQLCACKGRGSGKRTPLASSSPRLEEDVVRRDGHPRRPSRRTASLREFARWRGSPSSGRGRRPSRKHSSKVSELHTCVGCLDRPSTIAQTVSYSTEGGGGSGIRVDGYEGSGRAVKAEFQAAALKAAGGGARGARCGGAGGGGAEAAAPKAALEADLEAAALHWRRQWRWPRPKAPWQRFCLLLARRLGVGLSPE